MTFRKRQYPRAFRLEVARLVRESHAPIEEISRLLKVSVSTVRSWLTVSDAARPTIDSHHRRFSQRAVVAPTPDAPNSAEDDPVEPH